MKSILVFIGAVVVANGHVAISKSPNQLHPVHELFIKPSLDGTTGDLYVAATEESGSKTQWLTEQPVHFLPVQSQPANYEETLNSKRAIASPHLHYAYALPQAGKTEGSSIQTYPYTIPTASLTTATTTDDKMPAAAAVAPQYNPYHFFYPHMMSAYANMMNVLKDAGMSEQNAGTAVAHGSSAWPHSYAYPVQYVMMDPSTWAQSQTTTTASPANPTTTPVSNETD